MLDSDRAYAISQRILERPGLLELVEKMINDEAVNMTLQPRLEFLASISVDHSTEDTVLKFFDQAKLSPFEWDHDPDNKKYSVRADSYSVSAEILPEGNGQTPKAMTVLISIEADDFLEHTTLREVFLENDFSDIFRDFILIWDTEGAVRSWLSYLSLHVLENQMRKLIVSRLMGIEDERWWDRRVKPKSGGTYLRYRNNEANSNEVTHYDEDVMSDIFYTDFTALEKVISDPDNWEEVFEEVFRARRSIDRIKFLNKIRRKIAHNRFLSERNEKDLKDLFSMFNRAFRRVWR